MASPASGLTHRAASLPILAALALGSGCLSAWRLDPGGRLDLLTAVAASIAAGIVVLQAPGNRQHPWAALSVLTAAIICLCQGVLGIGSSALNASVWLLLAIGIVCWSVDPTGLARKTLVSSAALALMIPLLLTRFGGSPSAAATQVLAAMCAAVACATALDRSKPLFFSRAQGIRRLGVPAVPGISLWFTAGMLSLAATASGDRAWAVSALLTISAVFLVESIQPPSFQRQRRSVLPQPATFAYVLVATVAASGLAVAAIAAGTPFGWPVAGVALAACGSLAVIDGELMRAGGRNLERLTQLARDSRVDALTGLTNRRGFDERLSDEVARSVRHGNPLSLLMIDIDDFKQVNDRYGHAIGDEVLQTLALLIETSIRSIDIGARYGGEEFAVLLPETDKDGAAVVADRICLGMFEHHSPVAATVSIGVAELSLLEPSPAALLAHADAALYGAKRDGKNRVKLGA